MNNRELPIGTILNGKYIIQNTIGMGGFGITYRALDSILNVNVAIKEYYPNGVAIRDTYTDGNVLKVIPGNESAFEIGMERYINEARALTELFNLPGIVCVKDFFYENATAYIVMEYIDGISLKEYLRQNGERLSLPQVLSVMEPILSSLNIVHKHGLLHRDISPDNIMISKEGNVKLIDFGAARSYVQNSEQSMTVVLKHGYAPAEQYSRNSVQGAYTDVYSICATLYKMLTGVTPTESIDRLNGVPLKRINKYKQVRIPRYIESVILKGLAVNSRDRYQSIEDLYRDLYLSKEQVRQQRVRKLEKFLYTAVILLVVACVIGGVYIWQNGFSVNKESDGPESQTEQEKESEQNDRKQKFSVEKAESEPTEEKETAPTEESVISDEEQEVIQDAVPETEESSDLLSGFADEDTYAISVVKYGVLDNYTQEYNMEEILTAYYEDSVWQEKTAENGAVYVNFIGVKNGELECIRFEVTGETFVIKDIARNGETIANMNEYFEKILKETGVL